MHEHEPARHRHVDGNRAGRRPQHEAGGDGDEIDDGDVLPDRAVRQRHRQVEWRRRPPSASAPWRPPPPARRRSAACRRRAPCGRRPAPDGDRAEALGRMLAVGLDVERVVPVVRAARRQAHRHERQTGQPELASARRARRPRRAPRTRARSSSIASGARCGSGRSSGSMRRVRQTPAQRYRGRSWTQTGWSAHASSSRSPAESPYAHSSTSARVSPCSVSHCSSRRTFSAARQLAPSNSPVHSVRSDTRAAWRRRR